MQCKLGSLSRGRAVEMPVEPTRARERRNEIWGCNHRDIAPAGADAQPRTQKWLARNGASLV